jgi:hypothetical protein
MTNRKSTFTDTERRNWGFWDGRSDKAKGRCAKWARSTTIYRPPHPVSKAYGDGYWAGFDGEAHPNTKESS